MENLVLLESEQEVSEQTADETSVQPTEKTEDVSPAAEQKEVSEQLTSEQTTSEASERETEASEQEQGGELAKAIEKLESCRNEYFDPVIDFLIERCKKSETLVDNILQEHKTWEKCTRYVTKQAKEALKNHAGYVPDYEVYRWSEDYFNLDDKAEEEKKAAEKAAKEAERRKAKAKAEAKAKAKAEADAKETEVEGQLSLFTPKKKSKEVEGQLSLF